MLTSKEDSPISVLFISARSDHGGGPRHMYDVVQHLTKQGPVTPFVASPSDEPYGPEFLRLAKAHIEIPHRGFSFSAFNKLLLLVLREKIDIVHSHGRGAGIYSRLLGLCTKAKAVHTFHGVHDATSFRSKIGTLIDRTLSHLDSTFIFVSETEKAAAERLRFTGYHAKSHVIENGIDLDKFTFQIKSREGIASPKCGIFLRDDSAKAPDLFLQLVRSSEATFDQIQWSCAGISSAELAKWGKIPKRISISDRVSNPSLWLAGLDFYVSTSRSEGQPLGVLEAMASGLVCILSQIPAHSKFLNAGAAIPLNLANATATLNAIVDLANSPKAFEEIRQKARALAEKDHSLQGMMQKLISLYEELAFSPKRGPSNK